MNWETVYDSSRITAYAYQSEKRIILVRLTSGIEWAYENCSPGTWREFQRAASKGRYISEVLNHKHNHEA